MCAIVGCLSNGPYPARRTIEAMADVLSHRGPDACGFFVEGRITLGHRRLSVIDISDAANQPMQDSTGRYVIVFNGEIYNFAELRTELAQSGHSFKTRSDTEVILEAYKRWHTGALERFNGMFALALWDRHEQSLLLARDRIGKKPLFYSATNQGLIFASEIRALLHHPSVKAEVDLAGLACFLTMNYVSGDRSLLAGIRKLPPATFLVAKPGGVLSIQRYWSLAPHFHKKNAYRTELEAAEALGALIDDATRLRMVSDVPLGAFLSSGIDSAAVVASMKLASNNVETFSIAFAESSYNEAGEARELASRLDTKHRDLVVGIDLDGMIQSIVRAADEPIADNSTLPMWFLCRFAREHVTVALSGDGGDELFAGYETYVADAFARHLMQFPTRLLSRLADHILPVSFDKVSWDYKLRLFLKGIPEGWPRSHYSWRTIFDLTERLRLMRPEIAEKIKECDPYEDFASIYAEVDKCQPLDQALYLDMRTWLVDDVLVKTDRMSMAHGLEVRAPLLDYRVAEFAAALPQEWKLRRTETKYLLKQSQQQRLPKEVLKRRKKGFNAPMSHWLRGPLRDFAHDCLSSSKLEDYFIRKEIDQLWTDHMQRRRDNGFKLFGLVCFSLWLSSLRPCVSNKHGIPFLLQVDQRGVA
jgi:asparagine synthase (glutamine-hydrolysing)